MPDELAATFEFHVGVTELRDSLGFTVQEVARSGNPAIVHRYGQAHAALVPLWELRFLKALEEAVRTGEIDAPNFLAELSESGRT